MDIFALGVCAAKIAFVSSASSVINVGIAQQFAELGARLALISRNEERVTRTAQGLVERGVDAIGMAADVRDHEAFEQSFGWAKEAQGAIPAEISGAAGNVLAPVVGVSPNAFWTAVR